VGWEASYAGSNTHRRSMVRLSSSVAPAMLLLGLWHILFAASLTSLQQRPVAGHRLRGRSCHVGRMMLHALHVWGALSANILRQQQGHLQECHQ